MKRLLLISLLLLSTLSLDAQKVRFMPQWTPQAQFAGYYMAQEKGYFEEEGLDVEIIHINPTTRKNTIAYLRAGDVDITMMQPCQAMAARDGGLELVNVLQTSQNCGLVCVSKSPLPDLKSLDGMRLGVWKSGYGEVARLAASDYSLNVQWVPFISPTTLYVKNAVDGVLAYTYHELIQLFLATGEMNEENVLHFSDFGYNYPEDGLYVMEKYLNRNSETVKKFCRAAMKGWNYVAQHQDEALKLVRRIINENNIQASEVLQKMMLEEVLRLQIDSRTGDRSFAPISRELYEEISAKALECGIIINEVPYDKLIRP